MQPPENATQENPDTQETPNTTSGEEPSTAVAKPDEASGEAKDAETTEEPSTTEPAAGDNTDNSGGD